MGCSENLGAPPVYMLPPGSVIQCKGPRCCLDPVVPGIPSATPAVLGASRAALGDVCWDCVLLGDGTGISSGKEVTLTPYSIFHSSSFKSG